MRSIVGWQAEGVLASLINTAKLNDVDPFVWLADVVDKIVSGRTPINRIDELLAWNWKAASTAALETAA